MAVSIYIRLNKNLYLRDPEQSELGKNIIGQSIVMIESIGFEDFTFKKLAKEINSTEASIYRYFENKHKLLVYLISWYYAWIEFQINFQTNNITDTEKKIKIMLKIIAESSKEDPNISHIDESLLHKIVVSESAKAYLTKQVDEENQAGNFDNYEALCKIVASIIAEANPNYPYLNSLSSTIIETAHEQIFFSKHLPSITDIKVEKNEATGIALFLEHLVFGVLKEQK
jgi:AcrR family transcriptional regulator